MKIGEKNYIQQLQLQNEKALIYVIDKYSGLLMSVIRKHLFSLPERQEECFNDVLLKIWQNIDRFDENKNTFKEVELPDFTEAPYNDPYNDPDIAVKDEQRNNLQWIGQKWELHEDGTASCQIRVLYDWQEELSLEVTNKNVDDSIIADIEFQLQ